MKALNEKHDLCWNVLCVMFVRSYKNYAQLLRTCKYCILHNCLFVGNCGSLLWNLVGIIDLRLDLCRKVSAPMKGELIHFNNATVDNL